ncbi:Fibrinogen-like protein A [Holothuria leucospilota]|uniref:Fibrinogen-like protein A n=1 Tax=Holothuria leucospilota TaxID=206669 RepID=A0A9Q1CMP5_HOLLE|nr:Fibrinogen-like protein A [Holothuria leucospilota]
MKRFVTSLFLWWTLLSLPEIENVVKGEEKQENPAQESAYVRSIRSVNPVPVCPSVLEPTYPRDCEEIQLTSASRLPSGIYEIQPFGSTSPFNVYCDFDIDNGGWTVIQRRVDGSVDFNRGWSDYKDGFGCLQSEFWLGNEKIVALTRQREYQLRIELTAKEGRPAHAKYSYFRLGDENAHYRLFLGTYSGNSGGQDSLDHHREMMFTTTDADHDDASERNCANTHGGGWWFGNCDHSNLNGNYGVDDEAGIEWYYHPGGSYDLKFSEMKIRAISVHSSNN